MTDRQIFDLIVSSLGYKTTVGPIDKSKVTKAINGQPSARPSARLAQAAWELARRISPLPPPPPPPPPPVRLAPMTHYAAAGADARYCVHSPGVTKIGPDDYRDEGGFVYSENGLCKSGGRSGKFVAVLKPANSMDGKEPCDGYIKDGRMFPPWPPESYEI